MTPRPTPTHMAQIAVRAPAPDQPLFPCGSCNGSSRLSCLPAGTGYVLFGRAGAGCTGGSCPLSRGARHLCRCRFEGFDLVSTVVRALAEIPISNLFPIVEPTDLGGPWRQSWSGARTALPGRAGRAERLPARQPRHHGRPGGFNRHYPRPAFLRHRNRSVKFDHEVKQRRPDQRRCRSTKQQRRDLDRIQAN